MIDNIEHNVLKTVDVIGTAVTEVEQARKKKEEAQKVGHIRAKIKCQTKDVDGLFRKNC